MKRLSSLLVIFLLAGCADSVLSPTESSEFAESATAEGTNQGKFRNAHLFDQALSSNKAGKFGNEMSLNLIFSIDKQKVLERYGVIERYAVLERYKVLERYAVIERYEYAEVFNGYAITIDDSLGLSSYDDFLAELAMDDEILWFEPDFSVLTPTPTSESGSSGQMIPWSVAAVGGETSWSRSGDGSGKVNVDVYVLDTGVTNNDIDVAESLDMRDTGTSDAAYGDPADHDGHGTHVAGIIGAEDDADGLVGIAPGVRIHNLKVLDDNGTTDVSVVIAAVEEITSRKLADPGTPIVVNMSIGENIGTPDYSALDHAIEASSNAGVIYVVAAGNQGDDAANVTPAKVTEAITVGSYNILGLFSPFSNWGPNVDILAPGEAIVSLAPGSSVPVLTAAASNVPVSMSGTSMSAAHVTGAVALYVALHPTASATEARDYLVSTAQDFVVGEHPGTTTKSLWVGGTRIADLFTAISYSGNDGDQDWSANWTETGESNGTTRGNIQVRSEARCATGNCLTIASRRGAGKGVSRKADLTGATTAQLTFYSRRNSYQSASMSLEVSSDGGASWTKLKTYANGTDSGQVESFDISGFISSQTTVRFKQGSSGTGHIYIDDVEITAN